MHHPNVHLYTKDWAWKLIIIILPAMYKLLNFQECNVSHGGIAPRHIVIFYFYRP